LFYTSDRTLLKPYISNAPFDHSNKNPTVKTIKKNNIDICPMKPNDKKQIDHGNKKTISKSNITNKIEII